MKTEIKSIGKFHTLICKLDNDEKIAAIVFPSHMESNKSASYCKVNFVNGILEVPVLKHMSLYTDDMTTSYITDATVMEMDDCLFRVAANKNQAYLNTLTFNITSDNSFATALIDWLDSLDKDINKWRIFGGDLLNTDMLLNIYKACAERTNKQFYMHTSRIDILNDVAAKKVSCPNNVFIYARSSIHSDIIPMHNFNVLEIGTDTEGNTDLETFPDNCKIKMSIRLGEDNETRLRTKQPWFMF